jgi:hypothetical protein
VERGESFDGNAGKSAGANGEYVPTLVNTPCININDGNNTPYHPNNIHSPTTIPPLHDTTINNRDDIYSCPINTGMSGVFHGSNHSELDLSSVFDVHRLPRIINFLRRVRAKFLWTQGYDMDDEMKKKFLRDHLPFMIHANTGRRPVELWQGECLDYFDYSSDCQDNLCVMHESIRKLESMGLITVDWDIRNTYLLSAHFDGKGFHKPLLVVASDKLVGAKLVAPKNDDISRMFARKDKTRRDSQRRKWKKDPVMAVSIEFMDKVTPPTAAELWMRAGELVTGQKKNKSGKCYAWSHMMPVPAKSRNQRRAWWNKLRLVDIEAQLELYLTGGYEGMSYHPSELTNGEELANRRYGDWNRLPRWIRGLYRLNGELVVGVDACCLHPCIVGWLYRRDNPGKSCALLENDAHQTLADAIFCGNRDRAKLAHNKFWNTDPDSLRGDVCRVAEYIQRAYPDVWRWREAFNDKMLVSGRERHAQLFWHCIDIEAKITGAVMLELRREGILSNQCFDAVYVAERYMGRARDVFDAMLNKFGILTTTGKA